MLNELWIGLLSVFVSLLLVAYYGLYLKIVKIAAQQKQLLERIAILEQKKPTPSLQNRALSDQDKQLQTVAANPAHSVSVAPQQDDPKAPPAFPLLPEAVRLDQYPLHAVRPRVVLEPDERSVAVVSSIWQTAISWFTGGNTIVRVGVLILLIGVGLLLRLLNDMVSIPIEAWLGLIGLAAMALTGMGIRLRHRRRGYALSLQGAGLATLYLTLFSAYRLYDVLPSQFTFVLLAALASATAVLSLRQDALPLALLGFGGAFFAPLLTSTDQGHVVLLFGYYLLVNLALAWLAHRRTWKVLNLLGATATFGVAALWGWQSFDPAIRWPMQLLLLAHVLLYLFVVVRYSQLLTLQMTPTPELNLNELNTTPSKTATSLRALVTVDTGLLFGVPLVAFGLQAGLQHDVRYGLAVSSAVLAGLYLGLAYWLTQQRLAVPLLREGILALGLGFLALIVPLALDAAWTSTGWLIQGVALVWIGTRHGRIWQVRFGFGLQAVSLLILGWLDLIRYDAALGLELLIAFTGLLLSAFFLRLPTGQSNQSTTAAPRQRGSLYLIWISVIVGVWGLQDLWAVFPADIAQLSTGNQIGWSLWGLGALGLLLSHRIVWTELRGVLRRLSLLIGGLLVLLCWRDHNPPQVAFGVLLALLWVALQLWVWRHLADCAPQQSLQRDQTLGLAISLVLLSGWSFELFPNAVSLVLLPITLLLLLQTRVVAARLPDWLTWARGQQTLYLPVAAMLSVWVLVANANSSGQFGGVPYLPLLNLLDGCLLAVGLWLYRGLQQSSQIWSAQLWSTRQRQAGQLTLGALAFWSLSGLVVRSLHQWLDTPLWPQAWFDDTVQTSLTIVWSVTALLITVLASRYAVRALWWVGIGLLVLVTTKLLLVDLSNLSALARVISFIGAGGLMLVIGYFAPLPPESASDQARLP